MTQSYLTKASKDKDTVPTQLNATTALSSTLTFAKAISSVLLDAAKTTSAPYLTSAIPDVRGILTAFQVAAAVSWGNVTMVFIAKGV